MNLGSAYLELNAMGGPGGVDNTGHGHPFQVQEFRRPEFEVKATASEGPHFAGGSAAARSEGQLLRRRPAAGRRDHLARDLPARPLQPARLG